MRSTAARTTCSFVIRLSLLSLAASSAFVPSTISLFRSAFKARGCRPSIVASKTATRPRSRSFAALAMLPVPPVAKREEDRVVQAGVAPPGWDVQTTPRQSNDSTEALLDPSVPIPDPYGWLRNDKRDDPAVLGHLKQENDYTEQCTKHLKPLQESLYEEFLSNVQETDYTTPRPRGEYWYYTRTFQGLSYRQYCRAPKTEPLSLPLPLIDDKDKETLILPGEQVYLDPNVLAKDQSYCNLGSVKPSPSQRYFAYSVDYKGDEIYQVVLKDMETGQEVTLLDEDGKPLQTSGSVVWGADDHTLFYLTMDEQHRPYRLYRRSNVLEVFDESVKQTQAKDVLLKEEMDDLFWSHAYKSLDGKYVFFETASKETSEVWFLSLSEGENEMQCIAPRRNKVLYEVEHRQGEWWIWTNVDQSPNMKLVKAPSRAQCQDDWTLVQDASTGTPLFDGASSENGILESVTVLKDHVVLEGRQGGIPKIWVVDANAGNKMNALTFDEEAHDVGLGAHYEFDASSIVVGYDSLVTPAQSMELPLVTPNEKRVVLKAKQVPGYDKSRFDCQRTHVMSRDGHTQIPVSIVYRKDIMVDKIEKGEQVPIHLYGYGSYGSCCEADFSSTRLALLERGIVYVIAHVRGGGEMGREWYEEPNGAKYLCKQNTFHDFVDVARDLVHTKQWTTPDLLSCEGRSAGGMLVGATINQAPELFRCAILGVPFVDVVGTMLDASIPLTAGEWVEWGNPNEKKYFDYMMQYSPMNNVQSNSGDKRYPACWLTGGLHDPRVQYWEPTKFVATLRHCNPSNPFPFCLKIDMSAGHFSASDRYKYLKELSMDYAFLLDQLGLADAK